MIYTVTLNPSIDYVVEVNELTAGEIMRTKAEDLIFGGKGINVSSMLACLLYTSNPSAPESRSLY